MLDFEILDYHENLVTISCCRTFLIFIQSYIFNFCISFKCFFLYLYIPYCYYYKRVLILANIGDLVITAKFCARYWKEKLWISLK